MLCHATLCAVLYCNAMQRNALQAVCDSKAYWVEHEFSISDQTSIENSFFIFALSIYHNTPQLGIWVYVRGPRSRSTQKSFNVTMKKCLSSPAKEASNFSFRRSTYSTVQHLSYSFIAQNSQTVRLLDYFIISYQTWHEVFCVHVFHRCCPQCQGCCQNRRICAYVNPFAWHRFVAWNVMWYENTYEVTNITT